MKSLNILFNLNLTFFIEILIYGVILYLISNTVNSAYLMLGMTDLLCLQARFFVVINALFPRKIKIIIC